MRPAIILFIAVILGYTTPAFCKTYKCKDADGNTVFSDTACNTVAREVVVTHPGNPNIEPDKDAVQNCLAYLKGSQQIIEPESVKVDGHRFEWVAVKYVGSRRMIYLKIRSKNQYGVYTESAEMKCLMMGDGRTVSTYPYELLEQP